jgi:hypothetical protein
MPAAFDLQSCLAPQCRGCGHPDPMKNDKAIGLIKGELQPPK